MRYLLTILCGLFLLGGSINLSAAFEPSSDCIVFRNEIALDYPIEIGLRRETTGIVRVEAYRLKNVRESDGELRVHSEKLATETISDAQYRQIVEILENPLLRTIEGSFPPRGTDGWTWKIRRVSGKREIAYSFFCPEWRSEVPRIEIVVDLGMRFARAAKLPLCDVSPGLYENEPNKAPVPTVMSVTPAANAPVAPAAAAADL